MTSNVGSHKILQYRGTHVGEVYDRMRDAVVEELRKVFRPEFLNRVDETIVFHPLTEADLGKIVEIQLGRLRERLMQEHRATLTLTPDAVKYVAKAGYDPNYGARPLKRVIQKELETVLARKILGGQIRDGQAITVDYDLGRDALDVKSE